MISRHIELDIDIGADAKDWSAIQAGEKLKPVEAELRRIEESVAEVVSELEYLRTREQKLRDTNESTNERVKWFALGTMGMLVGLGAWQIVYLRAYFRYACTLYRYTSDYIVTHTTLQIEAFDIDHLVLLTQCRTTDHSKGFSKIMLGTVSNLLVSCDDDHDVTVLFQPRVRANVMSGIRLLYTMCQHSLLMLERRNGYANGSGLRAGQSFPSECSCHLQLSPLRGSVISSLLSFTKASAKSMATSPPFLRIPLIDSER